MILDILTRLTVNDEACAVQAPAHHTLLDALRGPLALNGTKRGCDAGECGSCNVIVDGTVVRACLVLVADLGGCDVRTIEGLGDGALPGAVQQAFIDAGAIQCGFCMPGMIVAATGLLAENPSPTVDEVRAGVAGTLCRCSGYVKVVDAVLEAARQLAETGA
jgi:carbon-monoxide dehydrogenase small subunit